MELRQLWTFIAYNKLRSAVVTLSIISAIITVLILPIGGFMFGAGDSMEPTYPDGCGIVTLDNWDGESDLENKIVVYVPQYSEVTTDIAGHTFEYRYYVIHRVIDEYKNYNPDTADHKVTPGGSFKSVNGDDAHYQETDQPYSDMEELRGEHVIVTMGDGNDDPDEEIIPVERVIAISEKDGYTSIPC